MLNLSNNIIGNPGAIALGKLIEILIRKGLRFKSSHGLRELYINSNKISRDGVVPFFNSLIPKIKKI